MITNIAMSSFSLMIFQWPVAWALSMLPHRIIAAPVAWISRYFTEASVPRDWCVETIRGRIARVLISRPIHARSQCELLKVREVPRPRASKREDRRGGATNKGRILTNMFGVWAQELNLADFTRE